MAHLLDKITYGFTENDLIDFQKSGLKKYLDEQLSPEDSRDTPSVSAALARLKLPIEYEHNGKKVRDERPFGYLNKSATELWTKLYRDEVPYREKYQPAVEVAAATWIRAVHSRWQLREMMVEFWHNHFSVNVTRDVRIALMLPVYDREVIRRHALGNFRVFLEAVAQSAAMQYYLDNATSKASPANENYARELFELHTLGSDAYLNHLYNRWRDVTGATEGKPVGYIDEDVYEAARAFTGWTMADGEDDHNGGKFPNTGTFHHAERWHDNYQKRVLGVELPPNQPPLADGRKVLDLVAAHPATARHIAKKLCLRFISDAPTEGVVQKAAEIFLKNQKAPDQIAQVVRFIISSEECAKGQKLKRPFELMVSLIRKTGMDFSPNEQLFWFLAQTGYRHFSWHTPQGHPDNADFWLNPNMLLARWKTMDYLTADWQKATKLNVAQLIPDFSDKTAAQIAQILMKKMLNVQSNTDNISEKGEQLRETIAHFLAQGGSPDEPLLGSREEIEQLIAKSVALVGMSPAFQMR